VGTGFLQSMRAVIVTTALLLTLLVTGCASLWDYSPRTPAEDDADYQRTHSTYKQLASAWVKQLKYPGGLGAPTISPLRKAHAVAFADWMTCVQGEEAGLRRTFAVFYRDGKIADFRQAVVIDGCEAEPYERLEPDVASTAPAKKVSVKP
jgi:hypothetical protein